MNNTDLSVADETRKPLHLQPSAEYVRTLRGFVLPEGMDWREALKPAYWHNVVAEVRPGDRIEVHSADHRVQFEVLVFGANDRADTVRFDVGFKAIWPLDLGLPEPITRSESYRAKPMPGGGWVVVEVVSGQTLGRFGKESEAREAIAVLERRDSLGESVRAIDLGAQTEFGQRAGAHAPSKRNPAPRAADAEQRPIDWQKRIAEDAAKKPR